MLLTDSRIKLIGLWTCTNELGDTCKFKIDGHRSYTQHGRGNMFVGCDQETATMALLCWAAHFWTSKATVTKDNVADEDDDVIVELES